MWYQQGRILRKWPQGLQGSSKHWSVDLYLGCTDWYLSPLQTLVYHCCNHIALKTGFVWQACDQCGLLGWKANLSSFSLLLCMSILASSKFNLKIVISVLPSFLYHRLFFHWWERKNTELLKMYYSFVLHYFIIFVGKNLEYWNECFPEYWVNFKKCFCLS